METECRVAKRHRTLGLMSNVFDGKSAVVGIVEDISRTGLRVSNIPASFEDRAETCYMVVNGPKHDFHLVLIPRWSRSTNRGMYKTIGFQVAKAPDNWTQFLECVENECQDDPFCAMVVGTDVEM